MAVRYEIGIVETRNVLNAILETYHYDFRDYALTSFKRRLEEVIAAHSLRDAEGLAHRLKSSPEFFDLFLKDLTPETTEMFRDPSLWRALRDEILPDLKRSNSKSKVWVANFDSGEELYSLCILLSEYGLLDSVQISSAFISDATKKKILLGKIDPKQVEVNEANYSRIGGSINFNKFFTTTAHGVFYDTSLLETVSFVKQDTFLTQALSGLKLVLFRNQSIYLNQTHQDRVLSTISEGIVPGGYLVLGSRETLENSNINHKFTVTNESEKIYKKKTG